MSSWYDFGVDGTTRNVASTCISVISISRAFSITFLEARTMELFPDVSSTQPREKNTI